MAVTGATAEPLEAETGVTKAAAAEVAETGATKEVVVAEETGETKEVVTTIAMEEIKVRLSLI